MLKLDFQNAFDSISWNYLEVTMKRMNFGDFWISWIHECLFTARISIQLNGSPSEEFSIERGVRQGDPLSPFLFNIAVEGLNCLLDKAASLGLIEGIYTSRSAPSLSLLQFANDTLIFLPSNLNM